VEDPGILKTINDNTNLISLSVRNLAERLHDKILEYDGGPRAIWEQLDLRFKKENKKVTGFKETKSTKISQSAFLKAIERLSKNTKTIEKMVFGIKGNPLLLMNVFEILGISGFKDLLEDKEFQKPNPFATMLSMNTQIVEIKGQLKEISERIQNLHKPRRTTEKISIDFEQITNRLFSVLTQSRDFTFDEPLYEGFRVMDAAGAIETKNTNITASNCKKLFKKQITLNDLMFKKRQSHGYTTFLIISKINNASGTTKRVFLLHNILYEYAEYCAYDTQLRSYYQSLKSIVCDADIKTSKDFFLTPFYILLFYLKIVTPFVDKVILNIESTSDASLLINNLLPKNKSGSLKYLKDRIGLLSRSLSKIIKYYNNSQFEQTDLMFNEYMESLQKAVGVFKSLFIDPRQCYRSEENNLKKLNLYQIYKLKRSLQANSYILTAEHIKIMELCIEYYSTLERSVKKDAYEF
jgi:DNA-binding ferritin-like protein